MFQVDSAVRFVELVNQVGLVVPGVDVSGFAVWHGGRMPASSELLLGRFRTENALFIPASAASKAVSRALLKYDVRWPELVYATTVVTMIAQTTRIPRAITSAMPRSSSSGVRPTKVAKVSFLRLMIACCS